MYDTFLIYDTILSILTLVSKCSFSFSFRSEREREEEEETQKEREGETQREEREVDIFFTAYQTLNKLFDVKLGMKRNDDFSFSLPFFSK